MKVTSVAGVKVYDLSQGKSLPEFLTEKARRKLSKNPDYARRIELLQDFAFPAYSRNVRVSRDGRYILASGGYKPHFKVFDVAEVSEKFERFCDADIVKTDFISDDYQKICLLLEDRSISFHSKFGPHDSFRLPALGRDMTLDRETCDMYIATNRRSVLRFNLMEGRFRQSWDTSQEPGSDQAEGNNVVTWNKYNRLVLAGGQDGALRVWDPRNRNEVASLQIANDSAVTALQFDPSSDSGLDFIVGDGSGMCRVFDLRSGRPVVEKEHPYGTAIQSIQIRHRGVTGDDTPVCVSSDSKQIKGWNWRTGDTLFNIEASAPIREITLAPVNKQESLSSGLIFASGEQEKIGTYFVPMLGPAPLWASFLENLTEELEEKDHTVYDDWRFVTKQELEDLNMGGLLGSSQVRPWMHGYFVDAKTFEKIKSAMTSMEDLKRFQQQAKEKKKAERIVLTKKLRVNSELAERSASIAKDDRFQSLFEDPAFKVDEESSEFKQMFPGGRRSLDKRRKRGDDSEDEEDEEPDVQQAKRSAAKEEPKGGADKKKEEKPPKQKQSATATPKLVASLPVRGAKKNLVVAGSSKGSFLDDDDTANAKDEKAIAEAREKERLMTKVPMLKRLETAREKEENVVISSDVISGEQSITFVPKRELRKQRNKSDH